MAGLSRTMDLQRADVLRLERGGVYGNTSQWPPFCGPTNRNRPALTSLLLAISTARTERPTTAATSARVIWGFLRSSSNRASPVFYRSFHRSFHRSVRHRHWLRTMSMRYVTTSDTLRIRFLYRRETTSLRYPR